MIFFILINYACYKNSVIDGGGWVWVDVGGCGWVGTCVLVHACMHGCGVSWLFLSDPLVKYMGNLAFFESIFTKYFHLNGRVRSIHCFEVIQSLQQ